MIEGNRHLVPWFDGQLEVSVLDFESVASCELWSTGVRLLDPFTNPFRFPVVLEDALLIAQSL